MQAVVKDSSNAGNSNRASERLIIKLTVDKPRKGHASFAARVLGLEETPLQGARACLDGAH